MERGGLPVSWWIAPGHMANTRQAASLHLQESSLKSHTGYVSKEGQGVFFLAGGTNLLVRDGGWRQTGGRQLSTATVGVLGCGAVGQTVARLCAAFGASVLAHDIRAYDEFYRASGVKPVSLDVLLRESDIVTIHLPLDASTRDLIGAGAISLMKSSALLVNTARGGIVDELALKAALMERRLGGAAADVFAVEPPADPDLLRLANFIGTSHIGGSTEEAVLAMGRAAIGGLDESPESIDLTA